MEEKVHNRDAHDGTSDYYRLYQHPLLYRGETVEGKTIKTIGDFHSEISDEHRKDDMHFVRQVDGARNGESLGHRRQQQRLFVGDARRGSPVDTVVAAVTDVSVANVAGTITIMADPSTWWKGNWMVSLFQRQVCY